MRTRFAVLLFPESEIICCDISQKALQVTTFKTVQEMARRLVALKPSRGLFSRTWVEPRFIRPNIPFWNIGIFCFHHILKRRMVMINVELKGGAVKEFENGITPAEIAKSIGAGLYKSVCCAKVDGDLCDLRTPLEKDCRVELLTFDNVDGQKTFWHTASHVLAQAVKRLYPNAKCAIGPAVDNGFYYDFDVEKPFSPEDLEKIKAEMKKIVKSGLELERVELSPEEAEKKLEEMNELLRRGLIPVASQGQLSRQPAPRTSERIHRSPAQIPAGG